MTGLRTLFFSLAATVGVSMYAQERGRPRPMPIPEPMPRIVIQDKDLKPITIASAAATVRIHGCAAETALTMVFSNPNDRQLSGMLYCPLPEGAVINGYALDVQGKMVDGVVVERQKARQVFETEVRKNVDPGLVEAVKGNNFKTRVYPIPPNGTRTVTVRYLTELDVVDGNPTFTLPLNFKDTLKTFKLRVEIAEGTVKPTVTGGPANVTFKKWERQLVAENTYNNLSLTEDMVIAIPKRDRQPVTIEKSEDGDYVLVDCTPAMNQRKSSVGPAVLWDSIALFWDASASRAGADQEKAFAFIRALFKKRPRPLDVQVIVFRNEPEAPKIFKDMSDPKELIEYLKTASYDGGTQLGALTLPPGKTDACLLFSDGVSNFGKNDPGAALKCPLYAFSSSSTTDYDFLRYLTTKTGGQYHNLKRLAPDAVVDALLAGNPVRFINAELNGKPLTEAYPSANTPATGTFRFAAKLPKTMEKSFLTLHFGRDGATTPMTVAIDPAKATEGTLLRAFYGRMKINDLMVFQKRNEKALVEAGKAYGMVTPGTSLLVLETLDQYVEHRVVPPKSLPKMRQAYYDFIEASGKAQKKAEFKRMEQVIAMWKEVCEWHKKDFKYDLAELKKQRRVSKYGGAGRGNLLRLERAVEADSAPGSREDRSPADVNGADAIRRRPAAGFSPSSPAFQGGGEPPEPTSKISIKAWTPDTPYMKVLDRTGDKAYGHYLDMRKEYGNAPSYYLDCADFFLRKGDKSLGLRVLSNVAEMELENAALLRVLGHRLAQIGRLELAALTFEEVLRLRPEEPQSLRDLALVLAELKQYDRAITLLYDLALKRWDRFQDIEKIALVELNRIYAKAKREKVKLSATVDERLLTLIDADVRIVMTWDADMTDMDLWVTEPSNEKCYYGHNRTAIGGRMSRDFTNGYGPEEYLLKKSPNGEFLIQTNYFGSRAQSVIGAVTVQATVFTNFGRENETHQSLTVRLNKNKEVVTIGRVTFGKDGKVAVDQKRHYQIKQGDTLYSIAKKELGDAERWEEIVKANSGLDPDKLKVGAIITLPSK